MICIPLELSLVAVFGLIGYVPFIDTNHINLLPGISISCGGIIAVFAFFRDRDYQLADRQRKSDEIYLQVANDAFDEVFNLLKNRNNDRMTWIRAARLLLQAKSLKSKLLTEDIKSAFSISEELLQGELYRVLSYRESENKNPPSLPPQFFYGIEDWETKNSLDEAALKADAKPVFSLITLDQNMPNLQQKALDRRSVIAVFDFLKLPNDYGVPFKEIKDWSDNWEDSDDIFQGAKRFVAHKKKYFVVKGKLIEKKADQESRSDS